MTGKELYRIWAPPGVKWVDWVRPVPFVALSACSKSYYVPEMKPYVTGEEPPEAVRSNVKNIGPGRGQNPAGEDNIALNTQKQIVDNAAWAGKNTPAGLDTIFIVDLPGAESVKKGIELAGKGYRPIPIFNGTIEQQGARATTDNQSVVEALRRGAEQLKKLELQEDATPVFLLDSNRLNRFKMEVSLFDNSWDVYPQDLPSADYCKAQGVCRVVVIGKRLSKDLKKILYAYQKKGLEIFLTNGFEEPKRIRIRGTLGKENE